MIVFRPFVLNIHMEEFRQMNIEFIQWQTDELMERYKVDLLSFVHQTTVTEWVDDNLEPYLDIRPPEGSILILEVDGNVVGMIALWNVNDEIGEIGRMWVRSKFHGNGYMLSLLNKILEIGRGFGYSRFRLTTPVFDEDALRVYSKVGFKKIDEYRYTNPELSKHWICMELKIRNKHSFVI